jgi:hypothetical protein
MSNKFNARRTTVDGETYDSLGEAAYTAVLDARVAAGELLRWRRGTVWTLVESPTGRARDAITYRPDFECWLPDGARYVLDYKGVLTDVFKLKAKLWRIVYPDVPLHIVRADGAEVPA